MPNSTASMCSVESDDGLGEVIALVNQLQDVVSAADLPPEILDLPQMVVVGEQSTGKSSVLENIVGRDFLPRGTDIVTRCPLVLQLIHSKNETYAEFLHLKGKKFTDFDEVKEEIQAQTNKEAGAEKAISDKPISLKIFSPDVPHLTLVDLPGLTKNPIGDQPKDIEEIIRKLVLNYIAQENTLILAVTTATQDLANSVALQLAKSVDPEGLRTIGIITKLDQMDIGTDARNVLLNEVIPLRRGYIGLINRNQGDIDAKLNIKVAHEKERRFYNVHKAYRDIADKMGSKYLRERLSEQLCQHIRDKLPIMQTHVQELNHSVRKNLEAMKAFDENLEENWQQPIIIELIQRFTDEFHKQLQGLATDVEGESLSGGAKLNNCFYTQIYPLLNQAVAIDKDKLYVLWRNMVGFNNMMFFTQQAFNNIVKQLLRQYKHPLAVSTSLAANIVKESVSNCLHKIDSYPFLTAAVVKLMSDQITKNENLTKEQLLSHLKAQKSFINDCHPDFMKQDDLYAESSSSDHASLVSELRQPQSHKSFANDEKIKQGTMIVHGGITPKTLDFVLTLRKLTWFKHLKPKGTVLLEELSLTVNNSKSKPPRYEFQRTGPGISKRDSIKMVVSFKTTVEEDSWLEAFRSLGVVLTVENGPSQPNVRNQFAWQTSKHEPKYRTYAKLESTLLNFDILDSTNCSDVLTADALQMRKTHQELAPTSLTAVPVKPENDPRPDFRNAPVLDEVVTKLYSYMKIVDETIHDVTPKYLSYFLVNKTLKYTKLKLLSDVQKGDMVISKASLLRLNEEEMNKRDEFLRIFNMTKNAMELMSDASNRNKKPPKKNYKKDDEEVFHD